MQANGLRNASSLFVMRYFRAIIFLIVCSVQGAGPAPQLGKEGRSLYLEGEFKQAARIFEAALEAQPGRSDLHFWLGKSYARLASISGPLFAPVNARKAQSNLENAVRLAPDNQAYREELFDFYLDSPEWLKGGLGRAQSISEKVDNGPSRLIEAKKARSGAGWHIQRVVLWTSGMVGSLLMAP